MFYTQHLYLVALLVLMQSSDRHYLYCRPFTEVSCEDNNQEDIKSKTTKVPYDPDQDYLNKVKTVSHR